MMDRIGALKGDPFGFFNVHSVTKQKNWKGNPLRKKIEKISPNAEKTERGDPSEKNPKKNKTGKKLKRGHFSLARLCMLR